MSYDFFAETKSAYLHIFGQHNLPLEVWKFRVIVFVPYNRNLPKPVRPVMYLEGVSNPSSVA